MKNEDSRKIANCLRDKLVKRAFLFGSAARCEDDEFSDIDLLVELDYSHPIGLGFVRMKLELEEILNRKVDLLTTQSVLKYIRSYIDSEKILIYEK